MGVGSGEGVGGLLVVVDEGGVGEEEAGGAAGQWRSGAVLVVGSAHG